MRAARLAIFGLLHRKGNNDCADEVTLSRKGAKSRTHAQKLRSTGTKPSTRAGRTRKPPADLEEQLKASRRKLADALEQQAATSEVLQLISSSPGELEPVFQAMLEKATRICQAKFGVMWLCVGAGFRSVAMHGPAAHVQERRREPVIYPGPELPLGRMARTRQIVHVADIKREQAFIEGFPPFARLVDAGGARTLLLVPLVQKTN